MSSFFLSTHVKKKISKNSGNQSTLVPIWFHSLDKTTKTFTQMFSREEKVYMTRFLCKPSHSMLSPRYCASLCLK